MNMQRYRSGHNEAVLKTVCPKGHVGSNPTLCVRNHQIELVVLLCQIFGEVPKRLKGLPWKGSRSLIAVRGFKSRLLRLKRWLKMNLAIFFCCLAINKVVKLQWIVLEIKVFPNNHHDGETL